jgi:hypothetical protein
MLIDLKICIVFRFPASEKRFGSLDKIDICPLAPITIILGMILLLNGFSILPYRFERTGAVVVRLCVC